MIAPRRIKTDGDAAVWLAPLRGGNAATPVLRFTTPTGQPYEIQLTTEDLKRISTGTADIYDADEDTVNRWLDSAAQAIQGKPEVLGTDRTWFLEAGQVTP